MVGSGSGSSLTGLGLNIVSRLPVKLSQEPQQCLRGLKRADFRGSVWTRRTGRAPRSQRGMTADRERERNNGPAALTAGVIQHWVGLNKWQVCKYACERI